MKLEYTQEDAWQEIQTSVMALKGQILLPLGPVHCGDLRPAGCGCVVLHMGWRSLPSELSCVTCPQLQPKSVCGHKYRKSISNSYRKILNFCVRKTFFNWISVPELFARAWRKEGAAVGADYSYITEGLWSSLLDLFVALLLNLMPQFLMLNGSPL